MANYLVLHIDMEFVAGVVCTGNGRFFPVRNGNEDFLWLYFFNDPYHNKVSFGKDNKKHFNNLDLNYYGDFFNHIIDENSKFTIRGIERPAIELLEYSGLLKLLIAKYKEKSFTDSPEIPTLITFSSTISQPARKMIVAYLSSKNFKIKSHLIPLPELISVYYNKLKMDNGNLVLFLKATNSTLHFMKLHFIDEYFLNDESVQVSFRGRGYDPRKKAITKFVVSEVNSSTARISNPDEIEKECDRFESTSDEWLRRVDATTDNRQVFINGVSLSTTPNMRRQVLVRKADIENDTWYYINELSDLYNTFESDNIKDNGKLALVILFGECFKNELIKQKFESLIGSEKLLISSLNKIFDILSIYPEIEFEKYGSAYERIELLKKLQAQNIDNEHVITIRKKAKDYFKEAKELYRIGSIVQAFSFIEKAKELDSSNAEILDFYKLLNEENIKLEVTSRICDEYVAQAKNLEALGKFDDAKKQLELAQEISNTLEIRKLMSKIDKKINELKIIENQEKEKKKALQHYEEAIKLISENNYKDAKRELESALVLDNNSQKISNKLSEVEAWRMLQEKQFTHFIEVAQDFISKKDWDNAEIALKEALKLIPEDADCLAQIRRIAHLRDDEHKKNEEFEKHVKQASEYFDRRNWDQAEACYSEALKIKLNDVYCLNKLTAIAEYRIKENEEKQRQNFEKIKAIADIHFAKNEFNDAEVSYKNALEILPNDKYCKNRLAKIKEIRDQVQKKKEEYENAIKQASDFFARGDWENAEIFYKKTLNIKPEDPICFAQIEKIAQLREEERNRNEEFEKHVIQASGFVEVRNWDQAAVCCNEALKIKPNDDYCKIKLAEILDARKRDEEEQEQFEKAFRQASDYFKEGDWENAEIFYKKALIIKPKDPICESHITKIAIQHIEDERKRNGEFEKHVKQASGYLEVRNWDQATACYNEALKIKPNDDYCKTKLAEILDALKRDEVEQEQFEKAFRQASACFKQGDLDNAEIFYKKALGLKPEDPICESRLKEIADLREKDAEFERYVKQASEFYDKRNWNQAEDSYKEALKIKPTDKTCLNRLAAITDYRNKENEERKRQKKLETSPKGSVKTFSIDKNRFFGKRTLIIVGSIFMLLCLILIGFLLFNNPDEKKIVKEPVKDSTYKQKPDTIIIKKPVENSKPESSNKNDAIKDRMEKKQKASFIINDTTLKFSNGYFRGSYNKKDTNMVKGYYYFTKGGGLIYKNDPMKRTVKVGDSLVGKWSKEGFYRGTLYSKDGDSIRINAGQK